jgi:DNA mismatch repair protein MutL
VGLKQEGDFISGNTDFSFESEEVTGSLFNEEEVEQTVNNAYQIHKKTLFLLSNQEWLLWISSGHQRVLYEQF